MTNGMTKVAGDCAAEELQFWEIVSEDDSMAIHEDAPVVIYDLEERTARFGETTIRFAKKIPHSPANNRLIDQLVGAGTSVGANYCEADDSVSKPDFKHRIGTCPEGGAGNQILPAHGCGG